MRKPIVVIVGPESTGKTMLVQRLATELGEIWIPEYVRQYADQKKGALEASDVDAIARGQAKLRETMAPQAKKVVLCDTDLYQTAFYSTWYYGSTAKWIWEKAREQRGDLYLFLEIDVPWVADPQRDMAHRRQELRDEMGKVMAREKLPLTLISGDWNQRFSQSLQLIQSLKL